MEKVLFYTTADGSILMKLIKKMINQNVFFSVNPTENALYEIGIDNDQTEWLRKTIKKLEG